MSLFTPFLLAFLLGWLAVLLLSPKSRSLSFNFLKLSWAPFLGIGLISILTFWLLYFRLLPADFALSKTVQKFIFALSLFLLAISLFLVFKKVDFPQRKKCPWLWVLVLMVIFVALFVLFIDVQWDLISGYSDGVWDAWAIWNLHAKFMYSGDLPRLFSTEISWSHNDYPLLTPGFTCFGWQILGSTTKFIPLILSLCFSWGMVLTLFAALNHLRDKITALAGTVFLITPPLMAHNGVMQYADIPLGVYFLISLTLLALRVSNKGADQKLDLLSGIMLGFCVFTKNEGWSFALSYGFLSLIFDIFEKEFSWKRWGSLLGSFAIIAAAALMVKSLAVPSDIFRERGFEDFLRLVFDWDRYRIIFQAFWQSITDLESGLPIILSVLVLLIVLIDFRKEKKRAEKVLLFGIIFLTAAQYFAIYLITPHDLQWHLQTSLMRLFVQLYPSLIFAVFYFLKTPFVLEESG